MKYIGIAIGAASMLIMWPFLPFIIVGAVVISLFKTQGSKQKEVQPKPAPYASTKGPMLGDVFAQARERTHTLNVHYMERCYRHPSER